jgi:DNA-binding helix-hairpin-helix protein with protein kinase domain
LPAKRSQMLKDLEAAKREHQLQQFLEKFSIADASIDGIRRGRKTTLRAYGIYTAADIRPYLKVPGFGPTYMGKLRDWRRTVESRFIFDAQKPIEQALLMKVEQEYRKEFRKLVTILETGSVNLRAWRDSQIKRDQEIKRCAVPLLTRSAQIKADLKIL